MQRAKTIAIARRLLIDRRPEDAARMLEPLLEPTRGDGQAVVRALLARIQCLHRGDPAAGAALLADVQPGVLSPAAAAEVALWLAWCQFLATGEVPFRRLEKILSAGDTFRRLGRIGDLAWSFLARADLYAAIDEPVLADEARREAIRLFHRWPDRPETGWLPEPENSLPQLWPGEAMRQLIRRLRPFQASHLPVVFSGERGTGKHHLARQFHTATTPAGPFVSFRYDATSPAFAEASLFGSSDLPGGRLAEASGGTLFIEEMTDLPLAAQDRLVRVLDTSPSFRLVAATTVCPAGLTSALQPDLLARLTPGLMPVPPLRERREDIPVLVYDALAEVAPPGMPAIGLTDAAMDAFTAYPWPGNIRQLRNELERILTLMRSEPAPVIDLSDLSSELQAPRRPASPLQPLPSEPPNGRLDDLLEQTERRVIIGVLLRHRGHITASAEALGLTRQGLHKKIKRLGIALDRLTETRPAEAPLPMN